MGKITNCFDLFVQTLQKYFQLQISIKMVHRFELEDSMHYTNNIKFMLYFDVYVHITL